MKTKMRINLEIFEYKTNLNKPRFIIQTISEKKSKGSKGKESRNALA
jgi:hypothetical protein